MPARSPAVHPERKLPRCPKCKSEKLKPGGQPPDAAAAECLSCGYRWAICGAKTAHGQCFGRPKRPSRRCRMHGADAGRPIVHGGRSKLYEKLGLKDVAERVRTDPELLSHRQNVELLEALIQALGESEDPCDPERLLELMEHQRRHKEAEHRREQALDQGISARQLDAIVGSLLTIIFEEVTDSGIQRRIGQRFARLFGRPVGGQDPQRALPGGGTEPQSGG
jgi:hypothetical protein